MTPEPAPDCALCPRLAGYLAEVRVKNPDWFNAPVPCFGPQDARLLVVGLAPGVSGANRTGRPFTGDYAGDLLYPTLAKYGFANDVFDRRVDDGLTLRDCMIANAVRCVPPQNKPTPAEIRECRPFLSARIDALPRLQAIVALGRVAHESVLRVFGARLKDHVFAHGARHDLNDLAIFDSYHCSRYNTNTGRLTSAMFESVFAKVRRALDG